VSRDYWEQRYLAEDMPWEKGAPSPGLVDFLAAHRDLTGQTVCVPGCGTGHDAPTPFPNRRLATMIPTSDQQPPSKLY